MIAPFRYNCNKGVAYVSYESALASRKNDLHGCNAFYCRTCRGWHAKPNVARDWASEPLHARPGPKSKPVIPEEDE